MTAIFGEVLTFGQSNGTDISLRVFGDEHYARYEDKNGYSTVYDDGLGLFCYARLSAGSFRSTGIPLSDPAPAGLVRYLQESQGTIVARAAARKHRRSAMSGGHREERVIRTLGPNQGLLEGRVLSIGTIKGLTILVNFDDLASTVTRADVDDMLNGANYTRNGNVCSANEYFNRVSSGKLDYTNIVVGPYTLSRNREFYVNNLLVEEALQLAVADGVDLKQFDSRNENVVDALNIMYAGQTQYRGELWPHNWNIDLRFGTMRTDLYLLTSLGRTPTDLTIGTFCHENGHLLCRFPDMYDYGERDNDSVKSAGIGSYCLMGAGNHNDNGRSPSPVCAYLRDLAGWCDEEIDLNRAAAYEARHGDYKTVMKYQTSKTNEYFLIENRSRIGLDRGLPASGLAVYHCDILGSNELQQGTATKHYQCALLQADGRRDLELDANRGDGEDLYGAIEGIVLSAASSPNSREWDGRDSGLVISDISAPAEITTFKVGTPTANLVASGRAEPMASIPDSETAGISSTISITESGIVAEIKVTVDIEHSYIGDLRVVLMSPAGRSTVLHPQLGGSTDNLVAIYDSTLPGELGAIVGQPMMGNWTLNVSDRSKRDTGKLRIWSVELRTNGALSELVASVPPPQ
ncbi:M6 family metalloprotease domain-containing protein [Pararhizobium sp. DWP1-1-3]|uniref:M6 family metalloprotease domain-containing protein n=1 Tax=Pararhizobium sp. DWP1-1-3 TaxID=2804652 RepID=UPI003CFAB693